MRIGVDVDGVLNDFCKWQHDYCTKKVFLEYNKGIVNPGKYDLKDIFEIDYNLDDEFWREFFYDYAVNEPARKFAGEVIDSLRKDGHEIYIITARFFTSRDDEVGKNMRENIINWLKKWEIHYDKLIFCNEGKRQICKANDVELMIEDKTVNINDISKEIPVICYDANYNKDCTNENVYRCYSWYDIYNTIKNVIDNK